MRIRAVGTSALMIEVEDPLAWFAALDAARTDGRIDVTDIVPGARTVLLDGVPSVAALTAALRDWPPPAAASVTGDRLDIPVIFDGPDLAQVAAHVGRSPEGVVADLTGTAFRVAFGGFAPGFAYLTGLPWSIPRLESPRPRVPAGSVALAAEYAGIYPTASPGGWQLVGRTDAVLFDIDRTPPALLTPGRTVRFVIA
ncbi:allophanate hydrolase subunit 1 [Dactylosporangium aurantiacum]|uniref:Allophanate hydrolase subunit 1 n=1 Tax=Dactylosporangium aurantiacum TaxID=35754 RepID=A0A9Q9IK19_9ACTN|nr:allophanate hydrolase subunit 1 [Dactylosporangium aurantiacum]MDG6101158.1 allophanate hydrolase subunit 1 [Dactylosporangium aurantiacum]UWZ54814.1 allophanate hydrolase subunit 1 [Dactylosporangium aurantiacum]